MTARNTFKNFAALLLATLFANTFPSRAAAAPDIPRIQQWEVCELTFTSSRDYANPYTDAEMYVEFSGPDGMKIRRPGFWDGRKTWRVRFAPPTATGTWTWRSTSSEPADTGLHDQQGSLTAVPYTGSNPLLKHGLLHMSPGHRNVVQADGTPLMLVGDTAWSLPCAEPRSPSPSMPKIGTAKDSTRCS